MFRRGVIAASATALLFALSGFPVGNAAAQTLGPAARPTEAAPGEPAADIAAPAGGGADLGQAVLAAPGAVFGSIEFRSESLAGLPQWTRVLEEMEREQPAYDACAQDPARCTSPALRSWREMLEAAGGLGRRERLEAVNRHFNRSAYRTDRDLYGQNEYWATPSEFLARSGDCEDYAIAKYFALRQLGFGEDELRIVILMDEIRAIGHAVLAVYDEDEILVLDSQSDLILPHSRYKHYVPQYSMNETTRWAHVGSFEWRSKSSYQGLVARK